MRRSLAPFVEALACLLLLLAVLAAPVVSACGIEAEGERTEQLETVAEALVAQRRSERVRKQERAPAPKQTAPAPIRARHRLPSLPRAGWHLPLRL